MSLLSTVIWLLVCLIIFADNMETFFKEVGAKGTILKTLFALLILIPNLVFNFMFFVWMILTNYLFVIHLSSFFEMSVFLFPIVVLPMVVFIIVGYFKVYEFMIALGSRLAKFAAHTLLVE